MMPKSRGRKGPAKSKAPSRQPERISSNRLLTRIRELDPHPGEWTFPLFAARAVASLSQQRYFYEALPDYQGLLAISSLNACLFDANVLDEHLQSLQVVVDVFPSMWSAPAGRLPLPQPDEISVGRHA